MKQQPESSPLDRFPPYDADAEAAVVASCLVDDHAIARVAPVVTPPDFFIERNGLIFEAMLSLNGRHEPTSPVMVAHELGQRGTLDAIGGFSYLNDITADLPTAVGVEHYAAIVARDATYRRLITAGGRIAQLGYQGGTDADATVLASYEALKAAEGQRGDRDWVSIADLTQQLAPEFLERLYGTAPRRAYQTGLRGLDRVLRDGGLLPGKLYVAGGYTSMGKSTFLRIILRNIALQGHHVALVTPEQDATEVWEELLFGLAQYDMAFHDLTGAVPDEREERQIMHAIGTLGEMGTFHISAAVEPSPEEIRLRLRRLQTDYPIAVCGIDYLHILRPDARLRTDNEVAELTRITKAIRDMAKETGIATVLMAQLNRASQADSRAADEFRPQITDFHGSSTIEKVAYAVLGLHRRGYYVPDRLEPDSTRDNQLEILVMKQQRGKRGVRVPFTFDGALSTIADLPEWS